MSMKKEFPRLSFEHKFVHSSLDGIHTYELIDQKDLKLLLQSNFVKTTKWTSKEWGFEIKIENEKQQLEMILNSIKKCKSKTKVLPVSYHTSKKHSLARVFARGSLSLGSIRREIRHTLGKNKYYDLDIKNCHFSILNNICNKQGIVVPYINSYCVRRDEYIQKVMDTYKCEYSQAKNLFIRLCYGGEFEHWIKSNGLYADSEIEEIQGITTDLNKIADLIWELNPQLHDVVEKEKEEDKKRSLLALYAQDTEAYILFNMFNYLVMKKYIKKNRKSQYGCVLCFDGIMIEIMNVPDLQKLLTEMNEYILKETGFDLEFVNKELDEGYDLSSIQEKIDNEEIELYGNKFKKTWLESTVSSDREAAEKICTIYPYWKYNSKSDSLMVFNFDTGMWNDTEVSHMDIIIKLEPYLYIPKDNGEISKKSYGNTLTYMKKIPNFIKTFSCDNEWFDKTATSSLGYLLFNNGYYNMKDGMFYDKETYGFNSDIVFFNRIARDFPTHFNEMDETYLKFIETIKDKLFYQALGKETGDYLITYIARAIAGDIGMKQILFGVGVGNSGKGTITKYITSCFGEYIGSFNGSKICETKFGNEDEAQRLRFALLLKHKRLIFSNEIDAKSKLDNEFIKKLASGGDELVGRHHQGNENKFIPHFNLLCFANDLPDCKVKGDMAFLNRLRVCSFEKSFVLHEPRNDYELKADTKFAYDYHNVEYQNALLYIILMAYKDFIEKGMIEPECVVQAKKSWTETETGNFCIIDDILEDYEFAEDGIVPSEDIVFWLKENGSNLSFKKLCFELKLHAKKNGIPLDFGRRYVNGKQKRCIVGMKEVLVNINGENDPC